MASFTAEGDTLVLDVVDRGEAVSVAISGTYNMTIRFERERGSRSSNVWEVVKSFSTANATEAFEYVTRSYNERLRLHVTVDTSGTATVTLTDSDKEIFRQVDDVGNEVATYTQAGVSFPGTLTVNGATIIRTPDGAPVVTKTKVPSTGTTSTSMSEAELLGGVHVKTPVAAQNYQVPTGTEISVALAAATGVAVEAGDSFDFALVNLGGAGDILTLTVDTGVTFVGSVTLDDAGADINSSGIWRFRNTSANVWVATRIA